MSYPVVEAPGMGVTIATNLMEVERPYLVNLQKDGQIVTAIDMLAMLDKDGPEAFRKWCSIRRDFHALYTDKDRPERKGESVT